MSPEREAQSVLVVDDEPQILRVLRSALEGEGYRVRSAPDGLQAQAQFKKGPLDLLITDLAMPAMDGVALCRWVRTVSQIPIIVLSVKSEERTKVQALDAGADDYVTKPFGSEELLARVRALLRRSPLRAEPPDTPLKSGAFHVDLSRREVAVNGESLRLTPKEFDLLIFFLRNEGRVLTRKTILTALWGAAYAQHPEHLRVLVGQLRKKIEPEPATPRYILTEPWIGYRFRSE